MDNYFSSYDLYKFSDSKNVFACGTVNMSRKHMLKNLSADKTMKRGEYDWAVSNDNIVCVKWKDRRCVHILSTMENAINECKIERKEKDGSKKEVSCPQSVVTYNKNMGFVDHFDHLKSLYEIDRKSQKWWHRLFFHFLDVCVTNAYILHTQLPDSCKSIEVKTLKDFRINIISHLMLMGDEGAALKRRSTTLPSVAIKKNKPSVPEETRFQNVQHMPSSVPREDVHCATRKKMCTKHEQFAKHVMCHYVRKRKTLLHASRNFTPNDETLKFFFLIF
ncbi:hypothetical protein AVEN_260138-1 [Araneus ventricosus]|uniref:PiggyBac transposable element-derived protein domain-containing protein n=1 Tax=Araneus ventricosus TaxID=182803 RepID=A0A4Y2DJ31_ARAVE|nr:hypothetical protein AVEN_260138-1 [Araneus ventricosus]